MLTHGEVIAALVANRLCAPAPLYDVAGWASSAAMANCSPSPRGCSTTTGSAVGARRAGPGRRAGPRPMVLGRRVAVRGRSSIRNRTKRRQGPRGGHCLIANDGAAGVDGESIEEFERDLKGNLYKLWNRLSSGSYFPAPVRAVEIPKKHGQGRVRVLGVPTVADRIAQTVVRLYLEPKVEPLFHPDSYGYRPGRSALQAVGVCRERCWRRNWVIDLDIRAFFDSVPHELVLRAVRRHTDERWILLYVERWLKAPLQQEDGTLVQRDRGTPQGSSISPLLANLFLHYAFDVWMGKQFPDLQFERYCDDGVVHCKTRSKLSLFETPSREGWRNVVWSCIQTRRASCTARMRIAELPMPTSDLTSLGTRFVLVSSKARLASTLSTSCRR